MVSACVFSTVSGVFFVAFGLTLHDLMHYLINVVFLGL